MGEKRVVSSACVTTSTAVTAVIRGNAAVVMQGELFAIIIALLKIRSSGTGQHIVLTDYINAARRITHANEDNIKPLGLPRSTSSGKAWYKWITTLCQEIRNNGQDLTVRYVEAHVTIDPTPDHLMNGKADEHARKARSTENPSLNNAPWPSFFMDNYTPWTNDASYIELDLYRWTKAMRSRQRTRLVSARNTLMDLNIFEKHVINSRYYTRTIRDYSLKIQILARGRALMTNFKTERLFPGSVPSGMFCPWCPGVIENEHHIFVSCERYKTERHQRIEEFLQRIRSLVKEAKQSRELDNNDNLSFQTRVENFAREYFEDGPTWVGQRSRFYLGLVPNLQFLQLPTQTMPGLPNVDVPIEDEISDKPPILTRSKFGRMLHMEGILLAGYIWSLRMRHQYVLRQSGGVDSN